MQIAILIDENAEMVGQIANRRRRRDRNPTDAIRRVGSSSVLGSVSLKDDLQDVRTRRGPYIFTDPMLRSKCRARCTQPEKKKKKKGTPSTFSSFGACPMHEEPLTYRVAALKVYTLNRLYSVL